MVTLDLEGERITVQPDLVFLVDKVFVHACRLAFLIRDRLQADILRESDELLHDSGGLAQLF